MSELEWFFFWFENIFRILGMLAVLGFAIAIFVELLKMIAKKTQLKFPKKEVARELEDGSQSR
jgi:hypothetical protein